MTLQIIKKIKTRFRFLCRKNRFLFRHLLRLMCNPTIQSHLDYAYSALYPNLNKILKAKLKTLQNKCIHFCFNLNHSGPHWANKEVLYKKE